MTAAQIELAWDGWMSGASDSYAKTVALLNAGKTREAADEYSTGYLPAIKKLFSEAAVTGPVRYSGSPDWCEWSKKLYVLSIRADRALAAGRPADAGKLLLSIREHFRDLRVALDKTTTGDLIYDLRAALAKDSPSLDEVARIQQALAKAPPPASARRDTNIYVKSLDAWQKSAAAFLKGAPADLKSLRLATEALYMNHGVQLE